MTRSWATYHIPLKRREIVRVVEGEVVTRVEETRGIGVRPHRACEHVVFEFDREGHIQSSCKTQYAGADIHIAVVDLLRTVAPHFRDLEVYDEGRYWETQDVRTLIGSLEMLDKALSHVADRLDDIGAVVEEASRHDSPKTIH